MLTMWGISDIFTMIPRVVFLLKYLKHLIWDSSWLIELAVEVKVEYALESLRIAVKEVVTMMWVPVCV